MGTLLILSLAGNFVLGILLLVRIVRGDDRCHAAELAAAIDYALDVLLFLEARCFLRMLRNGRATDISERFPGWSDYRDRHIAANLDLTV